jgi:hypothetical protein
MNSDLSSAIEYDEAHVNVEDIMRQIRAYLAKKQGTRMDMSAQALFPSALGTGVYDELYEASKTTEKLHVTLYLTPQKIPLLGAVWQRLRSQMHRLVVYYVNQLGSKQMRVNNHLIKALKEFIEDFEDEAEKVRSLEKRIRSLEKRLKTLEEQ